MTPSSVVVVGSFNQDLVYAVREFPLAGQTVLGELKTGPGGKGANQAVASRRSGAATTFRCAVGADAFADSARGFMAGESVRMDAAVKPDVPTGSAGILLNASGQNMIVVALGANDALRPADLTASLFAGATIAVFQLETPLETVAQGLRLAKSCGLTTILNPAPWRPDFDRELLRHVDVLVPNETEFAAMVGSRPDAAALSDEAMHQRCRGLGVGVVIVTLGAAGCLISTRDGWTRLSSYAGLAVVDTVGAGDAFVGGLAAALSCQAGDLTAAAEFATAVAGLSVTRAGAAPAMPRHEETIDFMRRHGAPRRLTGSLSHAPAR